MPAPLQCHHPGYRCRRLEGASLRHRRPPLKLRRTRARTIISLKDLHLSRMRAQSLLSNCHCSQKKSSPNLLIRLEQLTILTGPQTGEQSGTQVAPVPEKGTGGTKRRNARKKALRGPINPVPLHLSPLSSLSTTHETKPLFTNDTALQYEVGADHPQPTVVDLAVKSHPAATKFTDEPLDATQATSVLPFDAANGLPAADDRRAEPAARADEIGYAQSSLGPETDGQQPLDNLKIFTNQHDSPMSTPFKITEQHPQAQQRPLVGSQAPRRLSLVSAPETLRSNRPSKSRSTFKPTLNHHARGPSQQVLPHDETGDRNPSNSASPRPERTQEVLHGVSSRAGHVRVTKAPKQTPVSHDARPAANGLRQMRAGSTALDIALDALRTAYLGDQYRLEDQMVLKEKAWEDERSNLQSTITKQLETIAEQRVKIEQSEKRFEKLTDQLKLNQKYVSGLQRDHEDMKRSVVTFKEENTKALEDQIAQMLKEKEDLQTGLEAMIKSCETAQKSMSGTMTEIQLRYTTALSRENNLKIRLEERVSMHEDEKNRRIELEQQLLPSVQSMQRHLGESSAALVVKVSSLQASLENQTAEKSRDTTVKECLRILQELQSLPVLTSNDVRKAEGMLRYLYER